MFENLWIRKSELKAGKLDASVWTELKDSSLARVSNKKEKYATREKKKKEIRMENLWPLNKTGMQKIVQFIW